MQKIEPTWTVQATDIPLPWQAWIAYPGSFMQRLTQHGIHDVSVQVLREQWQIAELEEKNRLGLSEAPAFVREVLIRSEKALWMFARTVIPRNTLTGKEQELMHLENRSLGSVLFEDPTLQRSEFEITCLQPGLKWHTKVVQAVGRTMPHVWARRSVFSLRSKPLLLTEIFLPDIGTL